MYPRKLKDPRIDKIFSRLASYSAESFSDSIGALWDETTVIGRDERIYGLTFLMVLNVITSRLEKMSQYFERGTDIASKDDVDRILEYLFEVLSKDAYLGSAGLTSSKGVDQANSGLRNVLSRIHNRDASNDDYSLVQSIHDNLVEEFLQEYLPGYVQNEFKKMPQQIDNALKQRIGISAQQLDSLRKAFATLGVTSSREFEVRTQNDREFLFKYSKLVMTPLKLFRSRLEDLYEFPPFFLKISENKYLFRVNEQPFIWIARKRREFLMNVKRKHPNITGDSVEKLLERYLLDRKLALDRTLPVSLSEKQGVSNGHFIFAKASIRLSRNGREDIFSVLRKPDQKEVEVDLVANHKDKFSILAEAKYVSSYVKAEEYYYNGDYDKEPERNRLLNLSKYLNDNPDRKEEFGIPAGNTIIPAFITNGLGPLFADNDGIVKATPLEVMMVDPFYRLLREARNKTE